MSPSSYCPLFSSFIDKFIKRVVYVQCFNNLLPIYPSTHCNRGFILTSLYEKIQGHRQFLSLHPPIHPSTHLPQRSRSMEWIQFWFLQTYFVWNLCALCGCCMYLNCWISWGYFWFLLKTGKMRQQGTLSWLKSTSLPVFAQQNHQQSAVSSCKGFLPEQKHESEIVRQMTLWLWWRSLKT